MKPAKIIVIAVAAISAIGLALVVRAMGSPSGQPAATAAAAPAPVDTRPVAQVLVAASDLQPGQRLTEADLTWKAVPVEELGPGFVTDGTRPPAPPPPAPEGAAAVVARVSSVITETGNKADFVGAVVRERIRSGEPVLGRQIVRAGDSGYMAAFLEPGMRAMAIRVTVETAAGGFILPGDRVDVLLTRETTLSNMGAQAEDRSRFSTATVMQNVKVLAIDQTTRAGEDETAVVGATATLELGPRDAEALALAKSEGELSLVLRSYADTAGPSGRTAQPNRQSSAIRIFRGGAPEVVVVQ